MAITVNRTQSLQSLAADPQVFPVSATTPGDYLFLFIAMRTTFTTVTGVTDNGSNTWTKVDAYQYAGQNCRIELWRCNAANSTTSITADLDGSTALTFGLYELSGVDTADVIDVQVFGQDASSDTSFNGGSLTTTDADGLLLHGIAPIGTFQTNATSVDSSYTLTTAISGISNRIGLSTAHRIVSATGTFNPTFTLLSAAAGAHAAVMVRASGGGGGGGALIPAFIQQNRAYRFQRTFVL